MKRIPFLAIGLFFWTALAAQTIPTSKLLFYAPFDADHNDIVGNVKGKNYGATATKNRFNQDSSAWYFDGTDDWVDFGTDIKLNHIDSFTFSVWLQPGYYEQPIYPSKPTGRHTIIGDAGNGGGFRFLQYKNELNFQIQIDKTWDLYHTQDERLKHNWIHLVGVNNNGYMLVYANGVLVDSADNTSNKRMVGNLNFEVARGTAQDDTYWQGKVDDIRVYNKALTSREIMNLFLAESKNSASLIDSITCTDTVKVFDTITVINTINDTVIVSDTSWIYKYDTVTILTFDTIRTMVYDTIPYWDTLLSNDTLAIAIYTSLKPYPKRAIILYPNPASSNNDNIIIEIADTLALTNHRIMITNSKGQTVWFKDSPFNKYPIPVKDIGGAGVYHLQVLNQNGQLIGRSVFVLTSSW